MKYKFVFWDWNGTLFNDTAICHEITNEILKEIKVPEITFDFYRKKLRHPIREFYKEIVNLDHPYTYEWFADRFHQSYEIRRYDCRLHEHAEETVRTLRARNVTQSILSAHPQSLLNTIAEHLAITSHFDYIIGASDNLAASKIAEGRRLMQLHGAAPGTAILVGDTHHDAEVAEDLGIDCVLISQGMQCHTILEKLNVPLLCSMKDLLPFLEAQK